MTPDAARRRTPHAAHLFVPATRADLTAKAVRSAATAVILDLEDSVTASEKAAAREALAEAAATVRAGGKHVCVRVNNSPDLLDDDVRAALAAGADGLVVPKVEDVELLRRLDRQITEWEDGREDGRVERDSVELELQVETPRGLLVAPETATAVRRTTSMMLGVEDFSTALGVDPDDPDGDLSWAHGRLLMAAAAADLWAYGLIGAFSNFRDLEAYTTSVRRSRAFGYVGAYCIHPAQAEIAARGFAPSDEEVDRARRVVRAYAEAEAGGQSATSVDGAMVDRPIAERAQRLLDRAAATTTPPTKDQP